MSVPIIWKNLGSPSEPGDYGYRGCVIRVRERDILAVNGDDEAVVTVAVSAKITGQIVFMIRHIEHSDPMFEMPMAAMAQTRDRHQAG